jgi:hypothetical protein
LVKLCASQHRLELSGQAQHPADSHGLRLCTRLIIVVDVDPFHQPGCQRWSIAHQVPVLGILTESRTDHYCCVTAVQCRANVLKVNQIRISCHCVFLIESSQGLTTRLSYKQD